MHSFDSLLKHVAYWNSI